MTIGWEAFGPTGTVGARVSSTSPLLAPRRSAHGELWMEKPLINSPQPEQPPGITRFTIDPLVMWGAGSIPGISDSSSKRTEGHDERCYSSSRWMR